MRLAEIADEERIRNYFNSAPMKGERFSIRVLRNPDFFRLLKFDSETAFSFLIESEKKELFGLGSCTFRECYLDGRRERVGFLRDMRVSFDRRPLRVWRDFLVGLTKSSSLLGETQNTYFLTSILDDNRAAQRALVHQDKNSFLYEKAASFKMVNLAGRIPFGSKISSSTFNTVRGSELEKLALETFLDEQNQKKEFGYCFRKELDRRLRDWEGLTLSSFWILKNKSGQIIASMAPWNPKSARQCMVEKMPPILNWIAKLMPFSKWLFLPALGKFLDTIYLTHLEFDAQLSKKQKEEALQLMIQSYLADTKPPKWQMLSFCDFDAEPLRDVLKQTFFIQTISLSLYLVRHRDSPAIPLPLSRPGFEMALW